MIDENWNLKQLVVLTLLLVPVWLLILTVLTVLVGIVGTILSHPLGRAIAITVVLILAAYSVSEMIGGWERR